MKQVVKPLLTGDLCEIILHGIGCIDTGTREKMKNGLISANSFVVHAARTIKSTYDSSDKSYATVKEILYSDNFIELEYAMWLYTSPATNLIQEALNMMVLRTIESSTKIFRTEIIAFDNRISSNIFLHIKIIQDNTLRHLFTISATIFLSFTTFFQTQFHTQQTNTNTEQTVVICSEGYKLFWSMINFMIYNC